MGKSLLFTFLCVLATVASVASVSSVSCLDGSACKKIKILASSPQDLETRFREYASATQVDLLGNILEELPTNAFAGMSQLTALNLSYNLLENVPLESAPALQVVDLSYNQVALVTIPATMTQFLAVHNKLVNVEIPQNNRLEQLVLRKNYIDKLDQFSNAKKLKRLDLSCNRLKQVNFDKLSQMTELAELTVANNRIAAVSGSTPLRKLTTLDLSNNALTILMDVTKVAPNLRVLLLRNNNLVTVDNRLRGLNQLQSIDLRENDWECKDLETIVRNVGRTRSLPDQTINCASQTSNLCCTVSSSPFGDRVRWHYERVFDALQTGSAQYREGDYKCHALQPSPCDRDDSVVFEVARSKGQNNLNDLKLRLEREKQVTASQRAREQRSLQETSRLRGPVNELIAYIDDEYSNTGLTGAVDPVSKIKQTVQKYDQQNSALKAQIDDELDTYRGKLDEVNDLEAQLQELRQQHSTLQQDANKRNKTVTDYQQRIGQLKTRLGLTA